MQGHKCPAQGCCLVSQADAHATHAPSRWLAAALQDRIDWRHIGLHLGANSLASMSELLFLNTGLLSEATQADPFLFGMHSPMHFGGRRLSALGSLQMVPLELREFSPMRQAPSVPPAIVISNRGPVHMMPQLLPSADEVCSALRMLAGPLELCFSQSPPMVGTTAASTLLTAWARAWLVTHCSARMATNLFQHSSPLYVEQLVTSAASMVHMATALGRWQEVGR